MDGVQSIYTVLVEGELEGDSYVCTKFGLRFIQYTVLYSTPYSAHTEIHTDIDVI